MNEKLIEKKLVKAIKKLGGLAIKLFSAWFTGLPDRMILLPGGRIWFVELKTTGKNLTNRQKIVAAILGKLGFPVSLIDDEVSLNNFLKTIE